MNKTEAEKIIVEHWKREHAKHADGSPEKQYAEAWLTLTGAKPEPTTEATTSSSTMPAPTKKSASSKKSAAKKKTAKPAAEGAQSGEAPKG